MREHRVRADYIKHGKTLGYLHRKVRYEGRRGAPDDWFFGFSGVLVIFEGKRPLGEPRLQQQREIARLKDRGFKVYAVNDQEEGIRILTDHARAF